MSLWRWWDGTILDSTSMLHDNVLETIKKDNYSIEEQKNALFTWWMNMTLEEEKKWSKIVSALSRAGYCNLAERIAIKYGKKKHLHI